MDAEEIIYEIEQIRVRNNRLWMQLVKVAFEYAPNKAKVIFKQITEYDRQINELSKKLAE